MDFFLFFFTLSEELNFYFPFETFPCWMRRLWDPVQPGSLTGCTERCTCDDLMLVMWSYWLACIWWIYAFQVMNSTILYEGNRQFAALWLMNEYSTISADKGQYFNLALWKVMHWVDLFWKCILYVIWSVCLRTKKG